MKCEDCRIEMSSLIDGEIDTELHDELLQHLESCNECSEIFEDLIELENYIEALPDNYIFPGDKPAKQVIPFYQKRFFIITAAASLITLLCLLNFKEENPEKVISEASSNTESPSVDSYLIQMLTTNGQDENPTEVFYAEMIMQQFISQK